MTEDLEQTLTRTLHAAATLAPEPDVGFDGAVTARRQARRTRTALLAGVAAVAVGVPASVAVVAWGVTGPPASTAGATPSPTPPPVADLATARPAAEAWAGYAVEVPVSDPDGRYMHIAAQLDDHRVVVVREGKPGEYLPLAVYSRRSRSLTDLMPPPGPAGFAVYNVDFDSVRLVGDSITWTVRGSSEGQGLRSEVWSAPRVGGTGTRLVTVADRRADELLVAPGRIYALERLAAGSASPGVKNPSGVAVYPVGDDGALGQRVPGTEGFSPYAREWLVAYEPGTTRAREFLNVLTGQRHSVVYRDGLTDVRCAPAMCVGYDGDEAVAYRSDGSGPEHRLRRRGAEVHEYDLLPGADQVAMVDVAERYLWHLDDNTVVRAGPSLKKSGGATVFIDKDRTTRLVVDPGRVK